MSLKIAGMWLKINYVAKVFVQGPRLPTIELRVASRLLDFVLRWVLLVLLLLQQNSVLSSARASKFFDNSSLLVRFRCMGVWSNLPLNAGDQPACAFHAQTNYCIKPACVEWLSLNWLVHRQPMLYIISWCRVSNQISATTYNQTPVSQERKELWSPFLYWLVALVKCWSHTKSRVSALHCVWARDQNVLLSDLCKYQTFVPNFRRLLPLPLKMMRAVPNLEHMTSYPCCHWPPNFSSQCSLNWMW